MGYLKWALVALGAYTLVPPLMKVVTQDIPSDVATFGANGVLVLAALALAATSGHDVVPYLTHPKAPYMYLAGIALAVGILAYYRALALGPVNVVTPIFGMFIVTSTLLGALFLNESMSLQKAAGVGFAVLAVYLTATG
ncbi:EamA family transporter [Halobacteriaceae archaeon GCM10025711]